MIASSGGAVYGDAERLPASEELIPAPRSAYGAEKLCEETYLWTYRARGLRTVALRFGNVYGPRQDGTGEAGVVAISSTRLVQGLRPVIYGDGSQTRDFVYVADVAAATRAALLSSADGPLNVGTGRETSVREVVEGLDPSRRGGARPRLPARPARGGGARLPRRRPRRAIAGVEASNFSGRGSRPDPSPLRNLARTDHAGRGRLARPPWGDSNAHRGPRGRRLPGVADRPSPLRPRPRRHRGRQPGAAALG